MANYSHIVFPGGGGGFNAMLVATGTHILVPPYPGEETIFLKTHCYARVSLISLQNRVYDKGAILEAIRAPPALAACT